MNVADWHLASTGQIPFKIGPLRRGGGNDSGVIKAVTVVDLGSSDFRGENGHDDESPAGAWACQSGASCGRRAELTYGGARNCQAPSVLRVLHDSMDLPRHFG